VDISFSREGLKQSSVAAAPKVKAATNANNVADGMHAGIPNPSMLIICLTPISPIY